MEKYHLNSDDEPLEGFYDSDEELKLDKLKSNSAGPNLFGRLTSAFQGLVGNKELTKQDIAPILDDFS